MNTRANRRVRGQGRQQLNNMENAQGSNENQAIRMEPVQSIAKIKFDKAVGFALSPTSNGSIEVYLGLLEEAWKEFTREEIEEHLDQYLEIKSVFTESLKKNNMQDNNPSLIHQIAEMQGYEKLPMFSGEFKDWISFRDAFLLEVGESKVLEPRNKLRRLIGCLSGRARRVIGNWPYTDENYEKAWLALITEFENQDLALNEHLHEFLKLNKCQPQDSKALKELVDIAKGKNRDIMTMKGMSGERLADILWRKEVENRLDDGTKTAWLMSGKKEEIATCDELYEFLIKRSRAQEASSAKETSGGNTTRVRAFGCLFCNSLSHSIVTCGDFGRLNVDERRKNCYMNNRCFKCLKQGHTTGRCGDSMQSCRNCGNVRHNELLCMIKPK